MIGSYRKLKTELKTNINIMKRFDYLELWSRVLRIFSVFKVVPLPDELLDFTSKLFFASYYFEISTVYYSSAISVTCSIYYKFKSANIRWEFELSSLSISTPTFELWAKRSWLNLFSLYCEESVGNGLSKLNS